MIKHCICSHDYKSHSITSGGWCFACSFRLGDLSKSFCGEFKLDNLKLIEDLAKERKLI
jgi:hypothetical protein